MEETAHELGIESCRVHDGEEVGRALPSRVRHLDGTQRALGTQRMHIWGRSGESLGHRKGKSWFIVSGQWAFIHGHSKI